MRLHDSEQGTETEIRDKNMRGYDGSAGFFT